MRFLIFFAGDPVYFAQRESGWMWLLTPIKHTALLGAFDEAGRLAWYTPRVWGNNYLDLRVVTIDLLLLVALMVMVPLLTQRRGKALWMWGWVSAVVGSLFGVAITYYSFASFVSWVTIGAFALTMTLFGVSLYVNWRRPPSRGD